jgi:hypothetical protein
MAHCEIPPKERWTKDTNCYSWSFKPKISSVRESQYNCRLLESQFTPHDFCDENHERWVEARVKALLEAVDNTHPGGI